MASALLLHRDDLTECNRSVKSDPLMPLEARSPLKDELNSLNRDLENLFSQYGQSDLLEELRSRRDLKPGPVAPSQPCAQHPWGELQTRRETDGWTVGG